MQSREGERETRDEHYRKLLLVSDEIWKTFVSSYSVDYVKVVLEKRPTITPPSLSGSCCECLFYLFVLAIYMYMYHYQS